MIKTAVLKISDASKSTTPIICSVTVCYDSLEPSLKRISNNWTTVIPIKAIEQPKTADLVNFLLRKIRENIAVVTMTPPRDICQTDPAIKFSDI